MTFGICDGCCEHPVNKGEQFCGGCIGKIRKMCKLAKFEDKK